MNFEDELDRRAALEVACRWCHAAKGEPCVRKGTDEPLQGPAAHTCRIDDAGVVHAPLDSREIR